MQVLAGQENRSFPDPEELPLQANMPSPFVGLDGAGPVRPDEWAGHRTSLKEMLEHYLYGHFPPKPDADQISYKKTSSTIFTVEASDCRCHREAYDVTVTRGNQSHTFRVEIFRNDAIKAYPTIINILGKNDYGIEQLLKNGYMYVHIHRRTVAPDEPANATKEEGIFRLYPEYDWCTIAAWAWSFQVVIDLVRALGLLDEEKIVATGHSRGGQTAMAATIFDERISLVAPCTGGFWSVGSHRQRDPAGERGRVDLARYIRKQQPHWYHPRYWGFGSAEPEVTNREALHRLPWDATTLIALVAPRPICHFNVVNDPYNNALAQEAGIRAGQLIYSWWGRPDAIRMHWRDVTNKYGQQGHDYGPEEYNALLDFCQEQFFGDAPGTTTWNQAPGSDTWLYDPDAHPLLIDWSVPAEAPVS